MKLVTQKKKNNKNSLYQHLSIIIFRYAPRGYMCSISAPMSSFGHRSNYDSKLFYKWSIFYAANLEREDLHLKNKTFYFFKKY